MKGRATGGRRDLLPQGKRPGSLPWMIAATCFLAVIAVAAALGLARAAGELDRAGLGRYTIELVDPDARRIEAVAARLLARLAADPGIAGAVRVPEHDIAALLAPSLGTMALGTLPLPVLIDVVLRPGATESSLAAIVRSQPRAHLIRAADGLAPLARLVTALRRLAWGIVAMAAAVTILIAILAARMAIEAHGATLATLHALGASDGDLATLVQRRTARDALAGGVAGLAAGAIATWIVGDRIAALGVMPGSSLLGIGGWILLALVPLALAAGATLATRLAVLATLARAP